MINSLQPRRYRLVPQWMSATALSAALLTAAALPSHADEALADLVEQVSPSVVTVLARQQSGDQKPTGDQFGMEGTPFGDLFRRFGQPDQMPMPKQGPKQGLGSGFVLEEDGLIVTNHHVVADADKLTVQLADGREFEATLVGADPLTDLALIQIEVDTPLPTVELGDSDAIRVGEDVVAIGNPFGLSSTVTTGIVSAKGRNISEGPYAEFIQTDAAINRGNSGGPLFNMEGDVVGVNSAIYSPTGGSVGLGFAVTSNIVDTIVADLKDDGQIDRGWIGVTIQPVNADIAAAMGLEDNKGALIADVVKDGPSNGILQPGDVILSFDGKEVDSSADLPRLVGSVKSGSTSTVELFRDGSIQSVDLTVAERVELAAAEANGSAASVDSELGASVASLTDADREKLGLSEDTKGLVVSNIDSDGPAAEAGLRGGDVILKVGSKFVESPSDLSDALSDQDTDPTLVLIQRGENRIFVTVRMA